MSAFIWEVTYMSALVFMLGFVLHYFAYKKGLGDLNGDIKRPAKSDKEARDIFERSSSNPFIKKWLKFGGGYYGIVAFVKLILIELGQLKQFLLGWDGSKSLSDFISINTLVNFLVEQIQNFVAAIIWPTDYLRAFSIAECAIFVGVTYAFFEISKVQARKRLKAKLEMAG